MKKLEVTIPSGNLKLHIERTDLPLEDLCGFATRQNPKRGFLFVSKVLGKHYPVKPKKMKEIHDLLTNKISPLISQDDKPLFLGFAETATGLACGIYDSWQKNKNLENNKVNTAENNKGNNHSSYFLHTTRYHFDDQEVLFRFQEEHSHATQHIVYQPSEKSFNLCSFDTLVLIDDEITTGKTMTNFVSQLIRLHNCSVKKIIVVSIKNWMNLEDEEKFLKSFPDTKIEFVEILKGTHSFEKNESFVCDPMPQLESNSSCKKHLVTRNYGRFGLEHFDSVDFSSLEKSIDFKKKTLVLGTGEFIYYPYLFALHLENQGVDVTFHSTTRSPMLVGTDITNRISFNDNYGDDILNFIYNVFPGQYEQVIICYETNDVQKFELHEILQAKNVYFNKLPFLSYLFAVTNFLPFDIVDTFLSIV